MLKLPALSSLFVATSEEQAMGKGNTTTTTHNWGGGYTSKDDNGHKGEGYSKEGAAEALKISQKEDREYVRERIFDYNRGDKNKR
jgi:hypothetical protein